MMVKALDDILADEFFTKKRFRERIPKIVTISDPAFDTVYRSDHWEEFLQEQRKLAQKNPSVDVFILGGLISTYRFNYSKHEFTSALEIDHGAIVRHAAEIEEGRGLSDEELDEKIEADPSYWNNLDFMKKAMDFVGSHFESLPENLTFHYAIGHEDLENMKEMYSRKVDVFSRSVGAIFRAMKGATKLYEKSSEISQNVLKIKDNLEAYIHDNWSEAFAEDDWEDSEDLDESENAKQGLEFAKEKARVSKKINFYKTSLGREMKRLYGLRSKLETIQGDLEGNLNRLEGEFNYTRYGSLRNIIQDWLRLYDGQKEVVEGLSENFNEPIADEFADFANPDNAAYFSSDDTLELERISDEIAEGQEKIRQHFHLSMDGRITKRDIPQNLREELRQQAKNEYFELLIGIHPQLKIYSGLWNSTTVGEGEDVVRVRFASKQGLSKSAKQRSINGLVKGVHAHALTTNLEECVNEAWENSKPADVILVGRDKLARSMPLKISQAKTNEDGFYLLETKEVYLVTQTPFYDVKKAKALENKEWQKTFRISLAGQKGITSGVGVFDFTEYAVAQGFFKTTQLAEINQAQKNLIHGMLTGDDHWESHETRKDWGEAKLELILRDPKLNFYVNVGDILQFGHYTTANTVSQAKNPRTDQALRKKQNDLERIRRKLAKRSLLQQYMFFAHGNHGHRLVENGLNPGNLLMGPLQTPYLSDEDLRAFGFNQKIAEGGYDSLSKNKNLNELPVQFLTVGGSGQGFGYLTKKRGKDQHYGKFFIAHKCSSKGAGGKLDPLGKTNNWLCSNALTDGASGVFQGHTHIAAYGLSGFGYIVNSFSDQVADDTLDHPIKSASEFGMMVGFPKAMGGLQRLAISPTEVITVVNARENLLSRVANEVVKPYTQEQMKEFMDTPEGWKYVKKFFD